jgi:hypothetical protein
MMIYMPIHWFERGVDFSVISGTPDPASRQHLVVSRQHTPDKFTLDTLAKYNVIKIGTTGPGQVTQYLTLPILCSFDVNTPGFQSIDHLLEQDRHPSTNQSLISKVDKFQDFCGRVIDEDDTPRLSRIPSSQTIVVFIDYIASLGKIRSSSLEPYLSVINSSHVDFGSTKPAQGHWIPVARKCFEIERSLNQAPTKAAPFPASYVLSILTHGLLDTTSSHHVRVCACLSAAIISLKQNGLFVTVLF